MFPPLQSRMIRWWFGCAPSMRRGKFFRRELVSWKGVWLERSKIQAPTVPYHHSFIVLLVHGGSGNRQTNTFSSWILHGLVCEQVEPPYLFNNSSSYSFVLSPAVFSGFHRSGERARKPHAFEVSPQLMHSMRKLSSKQHHTSTHKISQHGTCELFLILIDS